jgi:quercetin dioxygenase-like cupin family protein
VPTQGRVGKCLALRVVVLSGDLTFEMRGRKKETLRPGDAFYVPKGCEHRGFAATEETVRLISVCYPLGTP